MKKLSIIPILILFGALFTFSGCTQQQAVEQKITGTDGLVISFEAGMPPSSIYEQESFDLGVLMENKGQEKIAKDYAAVFITGIRYDSYNGITADSADTTQQYYKKSNSIELGNAYIEGNTLIPGGSEVVSWPELEYNVDFTSGVHPVTIHATSCYKYSTSSRVLVCLANAKAVLRDTTGSQICEVLGEKTASNSAAPVQVTKVTEYPFGSDGFKVMIEIQDVGSGDNVYDSAKGTDCVGLERKDQNKIYIEEVKLGNTIFGDTEDSGCNWLTESTAKSWTCQEVNTIPTWVGTDTTSFDGDISADREEVACKNNWDCGTDAVTCNEANEGKTCTCGSKHFIRLVDGAKTLICQMKKVAAEGVAQEDLSVKFTYGYKDSIQASMDINALEEY